MTWPNGYPETLERSQPSDGYLRTLRAHCLTYLLPLKDRDGTTYTPPGIWTPWVLRHTPREQVKAWAVETWGDGAITYDSTDKEAMMAATEAGVQVVHPGNVPDEVRAAIREIRKEDPSFMPRCRQGRNTHRPLAVLSSVTPSPERTDNRGW